uniref:Galectin n=1 Tax=Parascaris univalens TaxID=6257 RepID=A0A915CEH6_PARUN
MRNIFAANEQPNIEPASYRRVHEEATIRENSIYRADVEIRKYMDPTMAENGSQVHIGQMSVHLMANHRPKPSIRRESLCDDCNPAILEVSDDFLA